MKAVKWILIALALVAVILITVPKDGFAYNACEHTYTAMACSVKQCTKCGIVSDPDRHNWKRIGCTQKYCTVCGKTGAANHYYESVDCTNKWICRVCGDVEYSRNVRHAKTQRITYVDCSYEVRCTKCSELIHDGVEHKWSTYEEHQNAHCLDCGIAAPAYMEHDLFSPFFGFIGVCKDCGHVAFQIPRVRYVCAFIGLLMSIAAFIFIFINRKRIRVQGGKFIRAFTPDSQLRERGTEEEYC